MSDTQITLATAPSTISAYIELAKVRLSALVLLTTLVGYVGAIQTRINWTVLAATLIGTALVAAGANALNQVLEREQDARMERTRNRPLPSGRLDPLSATRFAVTVSIIGLVLLLAVANLTTAALAATALGLYVFAYTPLKQITSANTLVGAAVGAIPPVIGWAAANRPIDAGAWALFAILFVWQLPHFFSIAWIYRDDYLRGGFRMISVADPDGGFTARQVAVLAALLIPIGALPAVFGLAGRLYFFAALGLGVAFFLTCLWISPATRMASARRSFYASITYLPLLLILYMIDRI